MQVEWGMGNGCHLLRTCGFRYLRFQHRDRKSAYYKYNISMVTKLRARYDTYISKKHCQAHLWMNSRSTLTMNIHPVSVDSNASGICILYPHLIEMFTCYYLTCTKNHIFLHFHVSAQFLTMTGTRGCINIAMACNVTRLKEMWSTRHWLLKVTVRTAHDSLDA